MKTILLSLLLISSAAAQNAVIFKDIISNGGSSAGPVYVAGNWSGTSYNTPEIYIGGENSVENLEYETISAEPDFSYYEGLSAQFAALGGTKLSLGKNNTSLNLLGGTNVFNIRASDLREFRTIEVTGDGGILIFNINENLYSYGAFFNYPADKMVFNFVDAELVNIDKRSIFGTILAPVGTVVQGQGIDGVIIAENWINKGQELYYSPLPEPGAISLIGLVAFALLPIVRYRRLTF